MNGVGGETTGRKLRRDGLRLGFLLGGTIYVNVVV